MPSLVGACSSKNIASKHANMFFMINTVSASASQEPIGGLSGFTFHCTPLLVKGQDGREWGVGRE